MRKHDEHGHEIEDLYGAIGGPFYAVHFNGYPYAAFSSANQALTFWRGADRRTREYFHIEDKDGNRIRLEEQRAGHAYAIIEALERSD